MASSGESYYDCHAILAEETLLPSVFMTGATGIGRALDPSADNDDLQRGSKTEIPFWMIQSLAERSMVQLRMPKCYSKKLRAKAQAGAEFLDLRSACPYFYDMGMRLHSMISDSELPNFLMNAFSVRYAELLTKSLTHDPNQSSPDEMKMKARLTMEERQIFDAGCEAVNQLDKWRYNEGLIGRKRKLHVGTS